MENLQSELFVKIFRRSFHILKQALCTRFAGFADCVERTLARDHRSLLFGHPKLFSLTLKHCRCADKIIRGKGAEQVKAVRAGHILWNAMGGWEPLMDDPENILFHHLKCATEWTGSPLLEYIQEVFSLPSAFLRLCVLAKSRQYSRFVSGTLDIVCVRPEIQPLRFDVTAAASRMVNEHFRRHPDTLANYQGLGVDEFKAYMSEQHSDLSVIGFHSRIWPYDLPAARGRCARRV
ncbi:hypothetical protein BV25DRAFT_120917 [Artomyces pyxidatus]|uniref:Uncharacterized protein n=1 Tax=Artomyces pyxidatus TaxID=48021 RepID=A0ACB8TLL1_9AGAM|nr:hypothetical protein BV25DRAFT_120917 [Artomyces pyxidatus]